MLAILHRCLPIYYLFTCAILGLSIAWLVSTEMERRLTVLPAHSTAVTSNQTNTLHTKTNVDNRVILQRNIFNSSHSAQIVNILPIEQHGTTPAAVKRTPGNLKLIGTIVAGTKSLAVIAINKDIEIFHLQQHIPGHGTLITVHRNRAVIHQNDGTDMLLEIDAAQGRCPSRLPIPAQAGKKAVAAMVHNLGNNRWSISADSAANIRTNIAEIVRQIRIVPNVIAGKTAGFVIKRIQRGSIIARMGLKRGDILHAVNGVKLDSPEKCLQIFQQLREARNLNLALKRAGKSINFKYEIK